MDARQETRTKPQPDVGEDDGSVAHALYAGFGADDDDHAFIRFWQRRSGRIVVQSFRSSEDVRGRDMLAWLREEYRRPIDVIDATFEALGFWERMLAEGRIASVDVAWDGLPHPFERNTVRVTRAREAGHGTRNAAHHVA